MKKKLSIILVVLLVFTNMGLGSTNSYAASNTPLENMTAGAKIKFADKEWIILDPSVGYIILASNDGDRQWDTDDSNDYESSDIRKYLNGTFLDSLGEENEDLIMEVIWNCGDETSEVSKKVRDKVGLLTYSEYENYKNGLVLDLNDWNYNWWLLTPYSGHYTNVWVVYTDGNLDHYAPITLSLGVRPALYLKSGLFVSAVTYDGNGNDGGTVPTDSNNYLKNTTVTVLDNTGALTKTGYTFAGWNTRADGNGTDYASDATFTMGSENVILYAKWTADQADTVIDIAGILGVTEPVNGATPVTTATETSEYTATVAWSPADSKFGASTSYTATITITPKAGYTLTGVSDNFFTVAGATATNAANSGVVTAVFPETAVSLSNDTTITSSSYTVNITNKTITNVPYGTGKSHFQDNISKGHIGQT